MCEKVVESVFWPRWQVSTRAQVGSNISSLPSTKLQWMLLWITAGCLFVCFSQTSKNCWLQPFRTCHRLAAIVTLVAISALTKASGLPPSLTRQLSHPGPAEGKDFPVGTVFRTCLLDFLFHLSTGGVNWILCPVFHFDWFKIAFGLVKLAG